MSDKIKGRVTIYASGGGGINIVASRFEEHRNKPAPGFAALEPVYIDTSKSNLLRTKVLEEAVYHIDNKDGAGQVRRDVAADIKPHVKPILHTYRPGDFAIVLHTAGGGSGSVIGPLLTAELLSRSVPTVVIMIGEASTRKFAENTLNTIKSYENIAKEAGAPIVIAYLENTRDTPRGEVDQLVDDVVTGLSALFSRENTELDTRDLHNWLRFDKVTTFTKPMLAMLSILKNGEALNQSGNVISVATLAKPGADATLPIIPEVRFLGLLPPDINEEVSIASPVHFVTSDARLPQAAEQLRKVLESLTEAQEARSMHKSTIGAGERADDTGLFL